MYKTLAATNQVRLCRAGQSQGVCNCPDLRAVKLPEMVMQVLFFAGGQKEKLELGLEAGRSRRAELTGERAKGQNHAGFIAAGKKREKHCRLKIQQVV